MRYHVQWANLLTFAGIGLSACGEQTGPPNPPADLIPSAAVAVTANSWIYRADMPNIARWRFATATVRNAAGQTVLYAMGGCTAEGYARNTVQAYNSATDTWIGRAHLPALRCGLNGAGVIDGKIYVTGGWSGLGRGGTVNLYVYNPATNTWKEKQPIPLGGGSYSGVTDVLNRQLYVYTDCVDIKGCASYGQWFFRYNPATDQWTALARSRRDHQGGVGGFIGGKFYLVGGASSTDLEVYDPATNQWSTLGTLPRLRDGAAGAVLGGRLYMMGGRELVTEDSWTAISRVDVYDPAVNKWATKAGLPTSGSGLVGGRVDVNGKTRIEVVGGYEPGNNLQYVP